MIMLDMSRKQDIDKIVYYPSQRNNDRYASDSMKSDDEMDEMQIMERRFLKTKYLYFNLVHRNETNIEKLDSIKVITQLEQSIMFIFCKKWYMQHFMNIMESKFNFKRSNLIIFCLQEKYRPVLNSKAQQKSKLHWKDYDTSSSSSDEAAEKKKKK